MFEPLEQRPKRSWSQTEDGILILSTDGVTYFVLSTYFVLKVSEKCPFCSFTLVDVTSVLVVFLEERERRGAGYLLLLEENPQVRFFLFLTQLR